MYKGETPLKQTNKDNNKKNNEYEKKLVKTINENKKKAIVNKNFTTSTC